jgi:hypothetical protein
MLVLRRILLVVGSGSLAVWIAIGIYMSATNRWGAFAVAFLMLPLFLIAAVVAGLGTVVCVWNWRHDRLDVPMSFLALVHGAIIYYASTHS